MIVFFQEKSENVGTRVLFYAGKEIVITRLHVCVTVVAKGVLVILSCLALYDSSAARKVAAAAL